MHKKQISLRLFSLLTIFAVVALIFTQFVGMAKAQAPTPPDEGKDPLPKANLDEIQNYYGRLSQLQGKIGVVVEFKDTPAALVYANAASRAVTKNQVQQIESVQTNFMSALKAKGIQATELYRTQRVFNGIWMRIDSKDVAKLVELPGVLAIHPIIPKTIDHTTSVPLIGAPQVWGGLGGFLGENVKIGVIDTGIDYVHTNFGGPGDYTGQDFTTLGEAGNLFPTAKVVGGWDFAGDDYNADPNSATYNPIPTPDPDPMDCYGHGSHVSGSAAGQGVLTDGSTYQESVGDTYADLEDLTSADYIAKFRIGPGVAPKASLYSLRVFGCEGSTDLTEQAIEWAMDPNGDADFSDHLDIINMSLGSSYGSEYDTSAIASNNAAQAGVLVVASAGNSGDSYYVTGAPAVARNAISVAASVDSSAVVSAFEAIAPAAIAGNQAAVEAGFGPDPGTPGVTADVVTTTPANGCAAISEDLTGKIALIDRGTCSFDVKVDNAQTAGAVGVLVANNVVGFPITMGPSGKVPDPLIPSMMTTQAVGDLIKAQLALPATVTIRLTSEFRNQFFMNDPAVNDMVASFSSRGPARAGTLLKPDLAAPGDSIFSTAVLTGNQGASMSGTSMASPHVAGVMALLRQEHPDWSVAELKALVMNTATNDIYTGFNKTGLTHTPTRVGAGRVSVANAVQSDVVAYYKDDPAQVSVAFGAVALSSAQTFVKSIVIENKNAVAADYNVTFDSRYQANLGLTFTLLDAADAPLSNPVTVPGSGTLEIKVKVFADPALLSRGRDATIALTTPLGYTRERFSEGGGYVKLISTGTAQPLRVPVHIAARPASAMSVVENSLVLPVASTGTVNLTPIGLPVATTDDASRVYITELMDVSPDDVASTGPNDGADLKYVGATSDYPTATFANASMYFSIATQGNWDTLHAPEFDIYIDLDEDGIDDFVLYNTHDGSSSSPTDALISVGCWLDGSGCFISDYVNWYGGSTNTNTFNNNVMTMDVTLTNMGLVDGVNTDFNFQIYTFNRDAAGLVDVSAPMHYDVANQSFNTVNPATGIPTWRDNAALYPKFAIGYNKANIAANGSKGLLLLHTHNALNTAEVVLLPPTDTANVDVLIAGASKGTYVLPSGDSTRQNYASVNDGPVKVVSTGGEPILAAQRILYTGYGTQPTSFVEMMGLPDDQVDTTYWFPWYKNDGIVDTQLRIGNVSGSTATVHIYIAGVEVTGSPFTLTTTGAGQSQRLSFALNDGPVKIVSDQKIVATERLIYFTAGGPTSFSEMLGLPNSQLSNTYWFPWYKNAGEVDTQLRIGNVSASDATVHIYIAGVEVVGSPFTLTTTGAGQSQRLNFAGVNDGPVKIVSDVNIVAAQRILYYAGGVPTSFVETMGIPDSQLSTTHLFPWYKNDGIVDTQLRIGNVSGSAATVHVYVGGVEMTGSPFALTATGAGQSLRLSFTANDGPVQIDSNKNIVTSERLIYFNNGTPVSFSEMMGLPGGQLSSSYWLPWYKNMGEIDTQLRFAMP